MEKLTPRLNDLLNELLFEKLTEQVVILLDLEGNITSLPSGASSFLKPIDHAIGQNIEKLLIDFSWQYASKLALTNGDFEKESLLILNGLKQLVFITLRPFYVKGKLVSFGLHLSKSASIAESEKGTDRIFYRPGNQNLFQHLIEHSYAGISMFDSSLKLVYRNPAAIAITGFNDRERTALSAHEMIHPDDQKDMVALFDEILQRPGHTMTCHFRSRHSSGHFIHLDCVITNWLDEKGINAIVINFRDVTMQYEANNQLERAVGELSAYKYALDEAAIVAITDKSGKITYVNEYFCRISGYSREELIGQDHRLLNSSYHPPEYIRTLWRTIAKGNTWRGELCNRTKDGQLYWVATTIIPFLNAQGKPYQYIAIRFDITAAKKADEELRQRSEQMNGLLESINDGFIALDHDLCYTYVNQRISTLVGIPSEEMLGKHIWDVFPDAVGSATYHAIEVAHRERTPIVNEDYYQPLGIWQENRIYPSGNGLSIFISDITERKSAEHQRALLNDISAIFHREDTAEKSLSRILRILPFTEANQRGFWLATTEAHQLKYAVGTYKLSNGNLPDHLASVAFDTGEVAFWNLSKNEAESSTDSLLSLAIENVIGIPLLSGIEVLGVLVLAFDKPNDGILMIPSYLSELGAHIGAELKRKQLKEELQTIFDGVVDIICTIGVDRRYKRVNRAMSALLGFSEQEILSMSVDELIHPEDLKESLLRMKRFHSAKPDSLYFENRYICKDGSIVHLAWTVRRATEKGLLFCVAKDITKQKQLSELLEEATGLARIGSWEVRFPSAQIYWSPMAKSILDIEQDALETIFGTDIFDQMQVQLPLKTAVVSLMEQRVPFDMELEISTSINNKKWIRILGDGEFINGTCKRIFGSIQDIDTLKRAQLESLERAKELAAAGVRYSELFQISPLPMFVFDEQTLQYLDVNQAAIDQYGYSRDEFLGMTLRDIRPEAEIPRMEQAIADHERRKFRNKAGTFTHIKKTGEKFLVEIVSSSLIYHHRPARLALVLDVTERNDYLSRIEEQNRKLRDISWIQSHVIRAPLSRIMGLMNLLREVEGDDVLKDIVSYMELSVSELDQAVHEITQHASGLDKGRTTEI